MWNLLVLFIQVFKTCLTQIWICLNYLEVITVTELFFFSCKTTQYFFPNMTHENKCVNPNRHLRWSFHFCDAQDFEPLLQPDWWNHAHVNTRLSCKPDVYQILGQASCDHPVNISRAAACRLYFYKVQSIGIFLRWQTDGLGEKKEIFSWRMVTSIDKFYYWNGF